MKKIICMFIAVIMLVLVSACGEGKVNSIEEGKEVEINEKLLDNEDVELIAKSITKEINKKEQEMYRVLFDVENKYKEEIVVKVEGVSFDGNEIETALYSMSNNIKSKDKKELVLDITDFDGYELPELKKEIELDVRVFSWTDPDFTENHKVKFKL